MPTNPWFSSLDQTRTPRRTPDRPGTAVRLGALLAVLLALSACGGSGTPTGGGEDTEKSSSSSAERRFLSLGSAPAGGAFFVVGGTLADVASAHVDGWSVTSEATKGSRENIRRLSQGELDFGLANSAITYFAVRGERGWDRAYDVRSVMTLAPNVTLFVTRRSSGIESLADLAGKRVVIGPAGAGFEMFVGPILEAHGISLDQLTVLNNTQNASVDMLADGSADAAFLGGAVPTPSILQAATSMDLVYLPYDARQDLISAYPFYRAFNIPADTYKGLDGDFAGLVTGAMHLITSASADEDMVYAFTKAIYENRDDVTTRHPAGRAINPKNVVIDRGTPFHPGAEKFYREIGIWPKDDAADAPAESDATEPSTDAH